MKFGYCETRWELPFPRTGCALARTTILSERASVPSNPQREPLTREVEIGEFFLGGYEERLRGGRACGKKTLCGVVVEVRDQGSGRVHLQILKDAPAQSRGGLLESTTDPGAIVHTDAWHGCAAPPLVVPRAPARPT